MVSIMEQTALDHFRSQAGSAYTVRAIGTLGKGRTDMLQTAGIIAGGLFLAVIFAGFIRSCWGSAPKAENGSRSDWASLSGGGASVERRGESDHPGDG